MPKPVDIREIIPGLNEDELLDLNEIQAAPYDGRHFMKGPDSTNPRAFIFQYLQYLDYLVETHKNAAGKTVVDIGAGPRTDGYIIADIAGASGYVGVECHFGKGLLDKLIDGSGQTDTDANEMQALIAEAHTKLACTKRYSKEHKDALMTNAELHMHGEHNGTQASIAYEDMLTFLARLPGNSAVVMASGIDRTILSDDRYVNDMNHEIGRVVGKDNAYIGYFSQFAPVGLAEDMRSDHAFKLYRKA